VPIKKYANTPYSGVPDTYKVYANIDKTVHIPIGTEQDAKITPNDLMNNYEMQAPPKVRGTLIDVEYEKPDYNYFVKNPVPVVQTLPVQEDQAFPGHQGFIPPTSAQPAGELPVNFQTVAQQSTGGIVYEVGKNLLVDSIAAGVASAIGLAPFGEYGSQVFSSIYNNYLRDVVQQNQNYKSTANSISQQIQAQAIKGYQAAKRVGAGDKATPAESKSDFINGNSNPKRVREEGGPAERLVRSRNEVNDFGFEPQRINPLTTVSDFSLVSAEVNQAFLPRSSTDLVGQSQQDYQSWLRNSAPFATR
jgi:hypothetical protein